MARSDYLFWARVKKFLLTYLLLEHCVYTCIVSDVRAPV